MSSSHWDQTTGQKMLPWRFGHRLDEEYDSDSLCKFIEVREISQGVASSSNQFTMLGSPTTVPLEFELYTITY